jgi:tRNA-Thr(GGU) m(6)t(6)A37 methyltransferase TsaA
MKGPIRPGEVALPFDPGTRADATVAFLGRIRTPWSEGNCPRNLRRARETGQGATVEVDADWRAGLAGLAEGQWVVLLYWMHAARRDLILQAPHDTDGLRGSFAVRSPIRPNPVSLAAVRITALDAAAGRIGIDAIDCFDGTPLIDIKPWVPTVDDPAAGTRG